MKSTTKETIQNALQKHTDVQNVTLMYAFVSNQPLFVPRQPRTAAPSASSSVSQKVGPALVRSVTTIKN